MSLFGDDSRLDYPMRAGSLIFLLLAFLSACTATGRQENTARRAATHILLYAQKGDSPVAEYLDQIAGKAGWRITIANHQDYLQEDSLRQFSGIVTSFTAINTLNHRSITSLKRYAEAGGGGDWSGSVA